MSHVTRIMRKDFVPTDEDYLKSYQLSGGINSAEVNLNGLKLKFFDLGGQRSVRRKWVKSLF
jgi:guanine nucleotide-binding protein G(i) subunit alpha